MTTFQDGPAKGKVLMLRRTPLLMRVTESAGKWDALNEIGDTPRPDETLYAYVQSEHRGTAHVNMGNGRGGIYPIVIYKHAAATQPTDAVMRDQKLWEGWCLLNDPRKST